jgi:hypothetical protein
MIEAKKAASLDLLRTNVSGVLASTETGCRQ